MDGSPEAELDALRESEERHRVLSDASREALLLDEQGVVRESNRALCALLGEERAELLGRSTLDFIAPESQSDFLACLAGAGEPREVTLLPKVGAPRMVEICSAPVAYRGRPMRAVALREVAFRAEPGTDGGGSQRLRSALDAAGLAIWEYDLANGRIAWSTAARSIFGAAFVDLGGTAESFMARIHPEDRDRVAASLGACVRGEQTLFRAEYRVIHPDGITRWVESSGQVLRSSDGTTMRMVGLVADVTQRQEFAAQLLHSQRLEATGRLAGSVAHDFNNLLTIIVGQADLARRLLAPDASIRDALDQISLTAERAAVLTRQLLIFARRDAAAPKVIDTSRTVRSAGSLIQRLGGADVEVAVVLDPDVWPVQVDPVQLEQLLVNLGVNARDAMPLGGSLRIHARNVTEPRTGSVFRDEWVEIRVVDDGVGMTGEVVQQAFEPFFTTKALGQGTGLGLSTCKSIVEQARGQIRAESTPGVGTTIVVRLPRSHSEPEAVQPGAARELPRGSETILVVEDELSVRRLMVRVLGSLGYFVLEACNGEDAVAQARACQGSVDLVLADVVMPGGSGPDVAAKVQAVHPGAKTLLVSGYPGEELRRLGFDPSESVVIAKPFSADQLAQWVRRVLG
jgi:two-component system, cell cycle sensor histidine kinase and response regulator CckA